MAVYFVKRKNRNKKIVEFKYEEIGYEFKPNIHSPEFIQISNLHLMDENLINKILIKKAEKSFRRLAAIALSVINDEDSTTGDAVIALDEIAKQKSIILKKYHKYLQKDQEEKLLKRLKVVEKDLKLRLIDLQEQEKNYESSYTR